MSPQALIATALLLGAYVFFGGAFGTCYALGQLREWKACARIAMLFYGLQVAVACAVVLATPLAFGWKLLIVVSTVAYAVIPSTTLRYLRRLHAD